MGDVSEAKACGHPHAINSLSSSSQARLSLSSSVTTSPTFLHPCRPSMLPPAPTPGLGLRLLAESDGDADRFAPNDGLGERSAPPFSCWPPFCGFAAAGLATTVPLLVRTPALVPFDAKLDARLLPFLSTPPREGGGHVAPGRSSESSQVDG